MLFERHIQNLSDASSIEHHWGYADRAVPCTNDAGSCAYLDVVYRAHDVGMLYTGIMWSVIGSVLLLWAILRRTECSQNRFFQMIAASTRRWLLPECRHLRSIFGRVTRLQVVVLAVAAVYLFIFSFVGITYATWITPVKNQTGVYNTRTSLGPWADRVGTLAYALTPLSILLASRESLLSVITGIPYHHFNFLHRWLGHVILAQATLHSIGWCVVEIRLYQPQPSVAKAFFSQTYIIWGVIALILLLLLWGLSTSVARRKFGYEFFRKAHYALAMVYIGACWAHWSKLKCFLLPSLLLWFADRIARLLRTGLIHYRILPNGRGLFQTIPATLTHFEADVVRIDFDFPNPIIRKVGQHFYLCFADGGIWQSHPFTPLSLPGTRQSYLIRAKEGETKRLASSTSTATSIIVTGPYGSDVIQSITSDSKVLCIAGGTGITFVLPILLHLAQQASTPRQLELVWVVRHECNAQWIAEELDTLREYDTVRITIRATQDNNLGVHQEDTASTVKEDAESHSHAIPHTNHDAEKGHNRPDLAGIVRRFVNVSNGPTVVCVSGPADMTSDVRRQVASCNHAERVWKGDRGADIRLLYDERLES